MNCNGCLEKLDLYLDRELTDAELGDIREHLERCPPCEHRYLLLAGMKRLVKVCCDQGTAPPELRQKLLQILF